MFSWKIIIYASLVVLIILGLMFVINRNEPETSEHEVEPTPRNIAETAKPTTVVDNPQNGGKVAETENAEAALRRQNLRRLQDLLDDDESPAETIKLALEMSKLDSEQKLAAIDAFNWIGGHESKMALVTLLKGGGEVRERAINSLTHLFQEDAMDADKPFDEDAFLSSLDYLGEADREALFIALDAYPVKEEARILIRTMDSENEEVRNLAFEHFESLAEGAEIRSKEEAEKWLENFVKKNADE